MEGNEKEEMKRVIGEFMRVQRASLGLSQEVVALKSGITTTYISQLERGIKMPTVYVWYRISMALGMYDETKEQK